jgi:glycosyltransferase involved in cell wall biosynthesis
MNKNTMYSAVIIAKNESRTIASCIHALQHLTNDVVVVLDDRSSDETELIALSLGCKVYKKEWEGYSVNKNYGVDKAQNDWIFCLDADEVMDEKLIESLIGLDPDISKVYEMNIQTYFADYAVKYCGWFPDWNIRLFNKKVMRWNSNFVHEKLESAYELKNERIPGFIKHFSFEDEQHMKKKFRDYARLRAGEWIKSGKKPKLIKRLFGPYFRFFRTYVLKLGVLDGKYGFIIAKNEYLLKKKELQYWREMNL